MKALEENLRSMEIEGLTWGAGKLVPLAFGIKKLQVNLVVEDEKVSIDDLQDKIAEDEDHVQSTDVVSSHSWAGPGIACTKESLSRRPCRNCRLSFTLLWANRS